MVAEHIRLGESPRVALGVRVSGTLPQRGSLCPPNMAQVVLGGPPDEAAEFRGNGNLEWDLPTGVIWWDERMHVLWASLWVTWPLDEASTWSGSGH